MNYRDYLHEFTNNEIGLKSSLMPVKQGVPQGSIVGPLLFVLLVRWKTRSAECGVWKMRSVENAECGKCGVWKMGSVENAECGKCGVWKMRGVENAECGKCGVWKMRSVENAGCGKCGVWKMRRKFQFSVSLCHSNKDKQCVNDKKNK